MNMKNHILLITRKLSVTFVSFKVLMISFNSCKKRLTGLISLKNKYVLKSLQPDLMTVLPRETFIGNIFETKSSVKPCKVQIRSHAINEFQLSSYCN